MKNKILMFINFLESNKIRYVKDNNIIYIESNIDSYYLITEKIYNYCQDNQIQYKQTLSLLVPDVIIKIIFR